ncbi:EF-hand calcium-binding domain-containing protein 6 [Manis javanica]|nr:EF-hand calcium-binding domain-containing protein 6 [Manis javanica]
MRRDAATGLVLLIRSIGPQSPEPSLFTKTPGTIKKMADAEWAGPLRPSGRGSASVAIHLFPMHRDLYSAHNTVALIELLYRIHKFRNSSLEGNETALRRARRQRAAAPRAKPKPATAVANPILSFLDVKCILFQKITEKGDELKRVFQLLDTSHSLTVSQSEPRRIVTTFLPPLTREQFQDVLAQIPVTSSGAIPYLEFLSRFGGVDLNINVIKRGGGMKQIAVGTIKELEVQVGEKENPVGQLNEE